MTKNRRIRVRITPLQSQMIKNKSEELGYRNKSTFARAVLLNETKSVERMINELHEVVCKDVRE